MSGTMPYAVSFTNEHMVHLYRHKDIQRRIPGTLVHIGIDWERAACLVAVSQFVDTRFLYLRKVELQVIIAGVHTPYYRFAR